MENKRNGILNSIKWSLLFIFIELISAIFVFGYKFLFDLKYQNKIIELFNTMEETTIWYKNYFNTLFEIIPGMMIITFIMLLIPFFIELKKNNIKIYRKVSIKYVIILTSILLLFNLFVDLISEILPISNITKQYSFFTGFIYELPLWQLILCVGIIAPIIEEYVFRKKIIEYLEQYGKLKSIIISALIFGIMHGNIIQFIYAFIFGVIFGYVYINSNKNLTYTTIFHIMINTISVIFTSKFKIISYSIYFISFIILIIFLIYNIYNKKYLYKEKIL